MVKVSLLNGETVEGTIEWIDGNGAWVRGVQRSRWIPLEALLASEKPRYAVENPSA